MMKLVVLSCVLAAATASGVFAPFAPLAYSAPIGLAPYNYRGPFSLAPGQPANVLGSDGRPLDTLDVNLDRSAHYIAKAFDNSRFHLLKKRSAPLSLLSPYSAFAYSAPWIQPYNYRGPLSLAPGQPANILGSDGRPLDTLDVNLDRSAHFIAKAVDNSRFHLLKKRSAPLSLLSPYSAFAYSAPWIQPYNYRGPLSLAPGQPANILGSDGRPLDTLEVNLDRSAHLTAQALDNGFHILKKRSASLITPVYGSRIAFTHTPLITPAVPIARISPISPITRIAPVYTHW